MEATRVRISGETWKKQASSMSRSQVYRRKSDILDFIESQPFMKRLTLKKFGEATGIPLSSVRGLLKTLVKDHKITRHKVAGGQAYTLRGAWRPQPLPAGEDGENQITPVPPPVQPEVVPLAQSAEDIELLAKDFHWQCESIDLREFIQWLRKKEEVYQ